MDQHDHPGEDLVEGIGLITLLTLLLATGLSLFIVVVMFSDEAQIGPDVGEIVAFDPARGPRSWPQQGIPASYAELGSHAVQDYRRRCILMPPVMAAGGGSLVIEAKEITRPPVFRVHWSGSRTELGHDDCGRSADLILSLVQLRALANIAGGFGPEQHQHSQF